MKNINNDCDTYSDNVTIDDYNNNSSNNFDKGSKMNSHYFVS